jgi:hypothetical protein
VIKRAKGIGGEAVCHAHANPFFDTREYEVEFTDGTIERYAANIITKNMYAQVNDEGNMFQLLDEIMDHDNFRMNTLYGRYGATYNMIGFCCFNEELLLLPKNPTEAKL